MIQDGDRQILFIRETFPEDTGTFTCRLQNQAGLAECAAQLVVKGKLSLKCLHVLLIDVINHHLNVLLFNFAVGFYKLELECSTFCYMFLA